MIYKEYLVACNVYGETEVIRLKGWSKANVIIKLNKIRPNIIDVFKIQKVKELKNHQNITEMTYPNDKYNMGSYSVLIERVNQYNFRVFRSMNEREFKLKMTINNKDDLIIHYKDDPYIYVDNFDESEIARLYKKILGGRNYND